MIKRALILILVLIGIGIGIVIGIASLAILAFPKPQEDSEELSCTLSGCHEDYIKYKVLHSPSQDDCTNCHEASGSQHPATPGNEFALTSAQPELCYDCHDPKNEKKVVHAPVSDGDCTTCHSPHGSSQNFMLLQADDEFLCYNCHDFDTSKKNRKHSPFEEKECMNCHNPHQSDNASLLNLPSPDLCFECHDKLEQENLHPPYEEDCINCHNPHTSPVEFLLNEHQPELCYECHDRKDEQKVVHGPVLEGKCTLCHNPHGADRENFLTNDDTKMCLNCHRRTIKVKDRKIPNIKRKMSRKYPHDPVENDGCLTCHFPHGSEYSNLLNAKFETTSYVLGAEQSFELCFGCHDSEMFEKDSTSTATNFRDQTRNLHYLHINLNKARNCILCHDVHGSDSPYLIRDEVTFGKWQLPINYTASDNGGSCFPGCHARKDYNQYIAKVFVDGSIKGIINITDTKGMPEVPTITIRIRNTKKTFDKTLSIKAGSEFELGDIPPGDYMAMLDQAQINDLQLMANTLNRVFTIKKSTIGDLVENLNFELKPVPIAVKGDEIDNLPDPEGLAEMIADLKQYKNKTLKNYTKSFYFKPFRSAALSNEAKKYLKTIAEFMKKNPKTEIGIIGHTDNFGALMENQSLSDKRAKIILDYMIENGIAKSRLHQRGLGARSPVASNDTPEGSNKNNRVEIRLFEAE